MKKYLSLMSCTLLLSCVLHAQNSWLLLGNTSTNPPTNYLGTTDAKALVFKVNATVAGFLDYSSNNNATYGLGSLPFTTTGHDNISCGTYALSANTSGYDNAALGGNALFSNTSGHYNASIGYSALYSNTTGYSNSAVGYLTLHQNTTGIDNTGCGGDALYTNTTGNYNTATGFGAMYKNTTGGYNTANGLDALYNNTTGSSSVATGKDALYSGTTGYSNVAVGNFSLYTNTVGHNLVAVGDSALFNQAVDPLGDYSNTAVGSKALYTNTSGGFNTATGFKTLYSNTTGDYNIAAGYMALYSNTTGNYNTGCGRYTLYSNTSGSSNTATGVNALYTNTTGDENTASGDHALFYNVSGDGNASFGYASLTYNSSGNNNTGAGPYTMYSNTTGSYNATCGYAALYSNTTGSNDCALGNFADVNAGNYSNTTVIGHNTVGTASNQVRVGDQFVTSIGGPVDWTNLSDGRFKKNVTENVPGLEFIKLLRPITYTFDVAGINKFLHPNPVIGSDGKTMNVITDESSEKTKEQIVYTGFIAQEVEQAAKKVNYEFSGVDAPKNDQDVYGLRYAEFVVPLVKAAQELSAQNDSLKNVNNIQQGELDLMQTQISEILSQLIDLKNANGQGSINIQDQKTLTGNQQSMPDSDIPQLYQNIPNPYDQSTTIKFYLPQGFSSSQIIVTDVQGTLIKSFEIKNAGIGQIQIYKNELGAGNYLYSLVIDGKKIDTKQMTLLK